MQIPKKSQFKLEEVSSITGVKPYVLRFWESEFDQISPDLLNDGKKSYKHSDIHNIAFIKQLLFDKKFTIEEAKQEFFKRDKKEKIIDQEETFEISNSDGRFKKELSSGEVQKLILAKAKISSIVLALSDLKKSQGWN